MTERPSRPFLRKQEIRGALLGSTLSSSARLVFLVLENHSNQEGLCWPSRSLIATMSGLSEETVRLVLLELQKARLVRWSVGHQNRKRFELVQGEILSLCGVVNPQESGGMVGQSAEFPWSIRRISVVNPQESCGPIGREKEGNKEERGPSDDGRLSYKFSVSQLGMPVRSDRAGVEHYAKRCGWDEFWNWWPKKQKKHRAIPVWVFKMDPTARGLAAAGVRPWLEARERSRAPDGWVQSLPGADVWLKEARWEDEWEEEKDKVEDALAARLEVLEDEADAHSCDRRVSQYWKLVDRVCGPTDFEEVLNG